MRRSFGNDCWAVYYLCVINKRLKSKELFCFLVSLMVFFQTASTLNIQIALFLSVCFMQAVIVGKERTLHIGRIYQQWVILLSKWHLIIFYGHICYPQAFLQAKEIKFIVLYYILKVKGPYKSEKANFPPCFISATYEQSSP